MCKRLVVHTITHSDVLATVQKTSAHHVVYYNFINLFGLALQTNICITEDVKSCLMRTDHIRCVIFAIRKGRFGHQT